MNIEELKLKDTQYVRNDDYTRRMPSPPRLAVPPPTMPGRSRAQLLVEGSSIASVELPFLHLYEWHKYLEYEDPFQWKYASRREAQKIVPFLFLGPMSVGRDRQFLKYEDITMVLSIRQPRKSSSEVTVPSNALQIAADLGIDAELIEISNNQELIASFPHFTNKINKHLHEISQHLTATPLPKPKLGKVLVTCESGNERSAAVVAAYIMQVFQMGIVEALQLVHERRFCIHIDETMKIILRTYSDILQAKRDVLFANRTKRLNNSSTFGPTARHAEKICAASKRTLDDWDEDMEDNDMDRFQDRGFNPFTDQA